MYCWQISKTILFFLQVLESCMKNCGALIHDEVASKEFMEFLKGLVNVSIDVELTWKCKYWCRTHLEM